MSENQILDVTSQNFETEVMQSKNPVLIDFWAPWCGPCRMVGPVIDQLAQEYQGKVKVGKINVDEHGDLASKFGIMSIPTVMLFKNGKTIERVTGARTKEEFAKMIEEYI